MGSGASAAAADAAPGTLRRVSTNGALLVASFGAMLAFLDATIVNVVFPSIRESFPGSSIGALSWVLNAYNVVFAAFLVAAGRFADLLGRRRTFGGGVLLFTLASAVCAAAPSLPVLIAGRLVQAAGAALLVPASLALVVEAFPEERRSHAIGLWGATAGVAAGMGPPLGGALVAADGWRLAFLVNLPFGLLALVAGRRVLVESRAPGRRTLPDLRGAALLAVSIGLLALAIVQGGDWGWGSAAVIASFAGAAVAGALFVASSRSHPVPVLDPKLLRIPAFAVANAVTTVAGIGFYAYLLNNILWLHYVWGWSLLLSGLAVAPAALVAALVAGVLGRIADERGHRVIAVPGALVWAGAYVWYATRVGVHPDFLAQWLPGQVLSGLGVGATLPVVSSAALAAVPGRRYATASAVVSSTRQLGGVLGVSLLVVIVGTPASATLVSHLRHGWLLSAGCFAAAALGSLALRREEAAAAVEAEAPPSAPLLERREEVAATGSAAGPLFRRLPEAFQARVLEQADEVLLPAGAWLFQAGEVSDALYVVTAGRLEVVLDGDALAEVGSGEVVGELGVLAETLRSASVRARRDSTLLRVPAAAFRHLATEHPGAQRSLTVALAEQLQRSRAVDPSPPAEPRVVSVVAVGAAPAERAASLLVEALGAWLDAAAPGRLDAEALDRAERAHDRVVLAADADDDWRETCLRQADRVVYVARAGTPPPAARVERTAYVLLLGSPSAAELVAWHDAVSPRHVLRAAGDDELPVAVARLAARLGGRSLGVVLAGGGARALAAVGVLEELGRAGFEVDRIAGASLGSLVAALHAMGLAPAEIDAACYDELVRRNPYGDYGLPRVALSRGRRLQAALERRFGETRFEELPRQLAVVSTDLLARRTATHRRGLLRDALRASTALPGLLPPVRLGDEIHVDGGLLDNLPVSVFDADEGPILAVNIAAAGSLRRRSGPPRMPALPEVLLRSLLVGGAGAHEAARAQATVVVTPDTRGIGLFEFHQLDRAIEAGRAAGVAAVKALESGLSQP